MSSRVMPISSLFNSTVNCFAYNCFRNRILLLLVLLSLTSSLFSSSQYFEQLTVEDGLFSNRFFKTYKSSQGNLWIAGINGIARYDGYHFQNFTSSADIEADYINASRFFDIAEDSLQQIWVVSDNGLFVYSQGNKHFERVGAPHIKASISLYIQNDSCLWVSCQNGKNYSVNYFTHAITTLPVKGGMSATKKDRNGHVWTSSRNGSIFKDGEKMFSLRHAIRDISFMPNDDMLVASSKGLYLITAYGGDISHSSPLRKIDLDLNNESITSIAYYQDKIWLGTYNGLNILSYDNDENFSIEGSYYNIPSDSRSLSNNQVNDICVDDEGIVWVSTFGGLNKFDESKQWFECYKSNPADSNSLYDNNVFPIDGTASGQLWFGTIYNGLSMLDTEKQQFKNFQSFNGRPLSVVRSIYTDDLDRVWVASGNNLFRAESTGLRKVTISNADGSPFHFKQIREIIRHSDGHFYLGIDGKILRLVESEDENLQIDYVYTKESVSIIRFYIDHLERVWCASSNRGLILLDPSQESEMLIFSKKQNGVFLTNEVQAIEQDLAGNLWVGTVNGLYRVLNDEVFVKNPKDIHFEAYFEEDGLPSNYISNILASPDSGLWLSSWNGILKYSPSMPSIAKFTTYSFSDGLVDDKYNRTASYYDDKNELFYFGTPNGVNYFKPTTIKASAALLQTNVEKVIVDGEEVISDESLVFSGSIDKLTIEISSSSLSSPEKRVFAWRMEGYSDTLTYMRSNRLELSDIKKGKYVLSLSALNDNGILGPPLIVPVVIKGRLKSFIYLGIITCLIFAFFKSRRVKDAPVQLEKSTPKYEFSTLTTSDSQVFSDRLVAVMVKDKPYLETDLNAEKLAKMVAISQGELSQVLSEHLNSNFYEFVNKYRVEEFTSLLTTTDAHKYTLEALSAKCGFSSKSTFYRAFKHQMGMTPAQYIKMNAPKEA